MSVFRRDPAGPGPARVARPGAAALVLVAVVSLLGPPTTAVAASAATSSRPAIGNRVAARGATDAPAGGTANRFACRRNAAGNITGAYGTAAAMGWEGNFEGVVACLGGSFLVQDGIFRSYGFGIYRGGPTHWSDADGYLPALVTSFDHGPAPVTITEFADRVVIGGDAYVLLYSRVAVTNPTGRPLSAAPEPSSKALVRLDSAPTTVAPHTTVVHDFVIPADRFGQSYPWPKAAAMVAAGGFDRHFAHMRAFWNGQLAQIAQISVPDGQLDDAYRSGFIDTQIARSGDHLDTGVNGYESEFSHDVIGILANLFTQGYDADAHALLLEARSVVGGQGQYEDGLWTYAWPWAVYLLKTGDLAFVRANFDTDGPLGASQPSIEAAAHTIAADRTGPGGIMGVTDDIDTDGLWTVDDYEALMGLAAYRYLATRLGDRAEVAWADDQYDGLLAATNTTLDATIAEYHLTYLPCSMVQPDSANRCADPEDANWAAPFLFGRWAWDGQLFGAEIDGPGQSLIDDTYDYGFGRLQGILPADTFGGYPGGYYSTAYDAGYGSWGLAGTRYRDQGILSYEFMIADTQSGPYSWWESVTAPDRHDPWVGSHPGHGQGSSPHAWGMANANKVLLDSLAAQRADGGLVVGRGVPNAWLTQAGSLAVSNFPTVDGQRLSLRIRWDGDTVTLAFTAGAPAGTVQFQLPAFIGNLRSSTAGQIDPATGTVTVPSSVRQVTVVMDRAPAA